MKYLDCRFCQKATIGWSWCGMPICEDCGQEVFDENGELKWRDYNLEMMESIKTNPQFRCLIKEIMI